MILYLLLKHIHAPEINKTMIVKSLLKLDQATAITTFMASCMFDVVTKTGKFSSGSEVDDSEFLTISKTY